MVACCRSCRCGCCLIRCLLFASRLRFCFAFCSSEDTFCPSGAIGIVSAPFLLSDCAFALHSAQARTRSARRGRSGLCLRPVCFTTALLFFILVRRGHVLPVGGDRDCVCAMVRTLPRKTCLSLRWMGRTPPSRHSSTLRAISTLRAFILATFQHFLLIWVLLGCYCIACCFSPLAFLNLVWAYACPNKPKLVERKCRTAAERYDRRRAAIAARRAAGDFRRLRSPITAMVLRTLSVVVLYLQVVLLLCFARVLLAFMIIGFLFMRVALWICIGRLLLAFILAWCTAGAPTHTRIKWVHYLPQLTLQRLSHVLF